MPNYAMVIRPGSGPIQRWDRAGGSKEEAFAAACDAKINCLTCVFGGDPNADRICIPCRFESSWPNWMPNVAGHPRSPELLAHLEEVARTAPR